ncbi:MAG TPA: bifunctional glycosyltransferase family 2/GtrA family protein [Candidatus Blautia faecavium]|uniref:Bifunctional glycosyltransferase family 2/GtrA family protein n=1 Tax=Candidatus Blautia faecavium TaxID=2838487 RepID=A0A9D2LT76_9FIRM|nr:bifunctional glycosyltransferase family 2/GtrA family protein [Candidatus Blautia faecavium]
MERIVIIPALDPDEKLRDIVERNWELEHQVILVDDGSKEAYQDLFQELSEKCVVLHHKENAGKGAAIKTALNYIKREMWESSVIGIMDADGQHLLEDMEKLLTRAIRMPKALLLGRRTIDENIPWRSRMGNVITRKVFQMMTGAKVSDTQTGLRAFSSELLDFMLDIPGERYEYEMNVLITCAREKIPMVEVPIHTIYHDKENSCSHFRRVRDSIRIYKQLFQFSAASFSSFLLDYGLFALFTLLLPKSPWGIAGANIGARVLSAAYNYTVNCRMVFKEKQTVKTAMDYLALAGVILVLNNIFLQGFLYLHIPVYPAKILTECILFLFSWMVQKKWIFRSKKDRYIKIQKSGEWS